MLQAAGASTARCLCRCDGEPGAAEALGSRAGPRETVPIRAGEAWATGRALGTRKNSRKNLSNVDSAPPSAAERKRTQPILRVGACNTQPWSHRGQKAGNNTRGGQGQQQWRTNRSPTTSGPAGRWKRRLPTAAPLRRTRGARRAAELPETARAFGSSARYWRPARPRRRGRAGRLRRRIIVEER